MTSPQKPEGVDLADAESVARYLKRGIGPSGGGSGPVFGWPQMRTLLRALLAALRERDALAEEAKRLRDTWRSCGTSLESLVDNATEATIRAEAAEAERDKLRAEVERLRKLVRLAHIGLNTGGGIAEVDCTCAICLENQDQ